MGVVAILIMETEQFVYFVANLSCLSLTQKCFDRSPPSLFTAVVHCSDWLEINSTKQKIDWHLIDG